MLLELMFPTQLERGKMPPISAVSPSGFHLAYVHPAATVEEATTTAVDDTHPTRHPKHPSSPKRNDLSADTGSPATALPDYRVVIASCSKSGGTAGRALTSAGLIDQTFSSAKQQHQQQQRPFCTSPRIEEAKPDLDTCSLRAPITTLQWLDESHLACGLRDGTVTIIARRSVLKPTRSSSDSVGRNAEWTPALSRCFHRAQGGTGGLEDDARRVVHIRLSGERVAIGDGTAAAAHGSEPTVWVLYGDRVVVCVGVEALVLLAR